MRLKAGFVAVVGLSLLFLIVAPRSFAEQQGGYATGTLVRAESCQDNCTRVVVQLGGVIYVAVQNATFHWQAYAASEFEENGPVDVRVEGSKLFLKRPNGKELRTKIVKRVRLGTNEQPKLDALVGGLATSEDHAASDRRGRTTNW